MNRHEEAGPASIMRLGMAFCGAKVLMTASQLGVFDAADGDGVTEPELRDRLGLHPRACGHFLDALVQLGMLETDGGRYRNSAVASRHLVRGRPGYLGGFLGRADNVLYPAWGRLAGLLRTGKPQADSHDSRRGDDMFPILYRERGNMQTFLDMMDAVNELIAPELADAADWHRYQTVADVGGARGNLLAHLLARHPHLDATVFDLPDMEPAFNEHMTGLGMADRVRFAVGDFFRDPLPRADVLIFGHVLEDWAPPQRAQLIRNAFPAVSPGGLIAIYDPMLDDRVNLIANLMASLSLMAVTHGGSQYTTRECAGWLADAGFADPRAHALASNDMLVIARKPDAG